MACVLGYMQTYVSPYPSLLWSTRFSEFLTFMRYKKTLGRRALPASHNHRFPESRPPAIVVSGIMWKTNECC